MYLIRLVLLYVLVFDRLLNLYNALSVILLIRFYSIMLFYIFTAGTIIIIHFIQISYYIDRDLLFY